VWDEPKRRRNIQKHGLDFTALTLDFFASSTILPGREGRLVAIGELDGVMIIAVVFAPRGSEAISVISMRPASRKERAVR
jgi:uncharacterized DUF497 family protein